MATKNEKIVSSLNIEIGATYNQSKTQKAVNAVTSQINKLGGTAKPVTVSADVSQAKAQIANLMNSVKGQTMSFIVNGKSSGLTKITNDLQAIASELERISKIKPVEKVAKTSNNVARINKAYNSSIDKRTKTIDAATLKSLNKDYISQASPKDLIKLGQYKTGFFSTETGLGIVNKRLKDTLKQTTKDTDVYKVYEKAVSETQARIKELNGKAEQERIKAREKAEREAKQAQEKAKRDARTARNTEIRETKFAQHQVDRYTRNARSIRTDEIRETKFSDYQKLAPVKQEKAELGLQKERNNLIKQGLDIKYKENNLIKQGLDIKKKIVDLELKEVRLETSKFNLNKKKQGDAEKLKKEQEKKDFQQNVLVRTFGHQQIPLNTPAELNYAKRELLPNANFRQLERASTQTTGFMGTYKGNMMLKAEVEKRLSVVQKESNEYKKLEGILANINKKQWQINEALGKNTTVSKSFAKNHSELLNYMKQYVSIYGAINLVKQIRDVTAEYEMQRRALGALIKDQQQGIVMFNKIQQMALESPYKALDIVKYTKQLAAYSIESKNLLKDTKMMADIAAGTGVDMGRLILAYGQVRAATFLRGQEARQFSEAGVPLIDMLAKKYTAQYGYNVSAGDVYNRISERGVSFEDVKEALQNMVGTGGMFENMQLELSNTLKGRLNKIADNYEQSLNRIGERTNFVFSVLLNIVEFFAKKLEHIIMPLFNGALAYGGVFAARKGYSYITGKGLTKKYRYTEITRHKNEDDTITETRQRKTGKYKEADTDSLKVKLKRSWSKINHEITKQERAILISQKHQNNALIKRNALLRKGVAITRSLGVALKGAFAAFAPMLVISALTAIGSLIYELIRGNNELKRSLANIDREADKIKKKHIETFAELADAVIYAAEGSERQQEAITKLNQTYGDILPKELLQISNLKREAEAADETTERYKGLIEQIKLYDDIKRNKDKRDVITASIEKKEIGSSDLMAGSDISQYLNIFDNKNYKKYFTGRLGKDNDVKLTKAGEKAVEDIFYSIKNGEWEYLSKYNLDLKAVKGLAKDLFGSTFAKRMYNAQDSETYKQYYGTRGYEQNIINLNSRIKGYNDNVLDAKNVKNGLAQVDSMLQKEVDLLNSKTQGYGIKLTLDEIKKIIDGIDLRKIKSLQALRDSKGNWNTQALNTINKIVSTIKDEYKLTGLLNDETMRYAQNLQECGLSWNYILNAVTEFNKQSSQLQRTQSADTKLQTSKSNFDTLSKINKTEVKESGLTDIVAASKQASDIIEQAKNGKIDKTKAVSQLKSVADSLVKKGIFFKDKNGEYKNGLMGGANGASLLTSILDTFPAFNMGYTVEDPKKDNGNKAKRDRQGLLNFLSELRKRYIELRDEFTQPAAFARTGKEFEYLINSWKDYYKQITGKVFDLSLIKDINAEELYKVIQEIINKETDPETKSALFKAYYSTIKTDVDRFVKDVFDEMNVAIEKHKGKINLVNSLFDTTKDSNFSNKIAEVFFGKTESISKTITDTITKVRNGITNTDLTENIKSQFEGFFDLFNSDNISIANLYNYLDQVLEQKMDDKDRNVAINTAGNIRKMLDIVKDATQNYFIDAIKGYNQTDSYAQKYSDILTEIAGKYQNLKDTARTNEQKELLPLASIALHNEQLKKTTDLQYEMVKSSKQYVEVMGNLEGAASSSLEMLAKRLAVFRSNLSGSLSKEQLQEIDDTLRKIQERFRTKGYGAGNFVRKSGGLMATIFGNGAYSLKDIQSIENDLQKLYELRDRAMKDGDINYLKQIEETIFITEGNLTNAYRNMQDELKGFMEMMDEMAAKTSGIWSLVGATAALAYNIAKMGDSSKQTLYEFKQMALILEGTSKIIDALNKTITQTKTIKERVNKDQQSKDMYESVQRLQDSANERVIAIRQQEKDRTYKTFNDNAPTIINNFKTNTDATLANTQAVIENTNAVKEQIAKEEENKIENTNAVNEQVEEKKLSYLEKVINAGIIKNNITDAEYKVSQDENGNILLTNGDKVFKYSLGLEINGKKASITDNELSESFLSIANLKELLINKKIKDKDIDDLKKEAYFALSDFSSIASSITGLTEIGVLDNALKPAKVVVLDDGVIGLNQDFSNNLNNTKGIQQSEIQKNTQKKIGANWQNFATDAFGSITSQIAKGNTDFGSVVTSGGGIISSLANTLSSAGLGWVGFAVQAAGIIASTWKEYSNAQIQHDIDLLKDKMEDLKEQIQSINNEMRALAGNEYFDAMARKVDNLQSQYNNALKQLELERSKTKPEEDEIKQYEQQVTDSYQAILDAQNEMFQYMLGSDIKGYLENIVKTFVDARNQGTSTFNALKNSFGEMVSSMIEKTIMTSIIKNRFQSLFDEIEEMAQNGEMNSGNINTLIASGLSSLQLANNDLLAAYPAIRAVRNAFNMQNSTGGLTGGIQGMSEETEGTLSGYFSAGLMTLNNIDANVAMLRMSIVGGNDSTNKTKKTASAITTDMAYGYLNHLAAIDANTRMTTMELVTINKKLDKVTGAIGVNTRGVNGVIYGFNTLSK